MKNQDNQKNQPSGVMPSLQDFTKMLTQAMRNNGSSPGSGPATVPDIIKSGDRILIPEAMTYQEAAQLLESKHEEDQAEVNVTYDFEAYPWDGAHALKNVLDRKFAGMARTQGRQGFFSFSAPKELSIHVGVGKIARVPWGDYSIPGVDDTVITTGLDNSGTKFTLYVATLKMYRPFFDGLAEDIRAELQTHSIYKGKAIRLSFPTAEEKAAITNGKIHPMVIAEKHQPRFIDLSAFRESDAVFGNTNNIDEQIRHYVYGPMESQEKIGVLLAGQPGVGKTLALSIAAQKATAAGQTVVYAAASDFPLALDFARTYAPAVVAAEDIDRVVNNRTERNALMDSIYNTLDGLDTKHAGLSVILTTNDLAAIPEPMLRPGRLHVTLNIQPPDSGAVRRLLVKLTGLAWNEADTNLVQASEVMAGEIPAVIEEGVKRAQRSVRYRKTHGEPYAALTSADLLVAAQSIKAQMEGLRSLTKSKGDGAIDSVVRGLAKLGNGGAVLDLDAATKNTATARA